MCGKSASVDRLLLVHEARVAADELVERFLRLPVAEAMKLGTRAGFERAVALVAAQLRCAIGRADVDAVREAVAVLDVDWARTTAAERRRLVAEAIAATGRATAMVPTGIAAPFNAAVQEVIAATRTDARRSQQLAIGAQFNPIDRRAVAHVTSSQGNFVRDESGRRVESFGAEARSIVASGLEQGLGRDDIAEALEQATRGALVERATFYWETVAASFISQGRSYAQMSSYAEAGIQHCGIEAVIDEQTTNTYRYLHGKTFSVPDALRRFDRI